MRRPLTTAIVAGCVGAVLIGTGISRPAAAQSPRLMLSQLTWFNRAGTMLSTVGPLADHGSIELSPDDTRIAVAVKDPKPGTHDIWLYDADGSRSPLMADAADENWPIWSPDGQSVALNSLTDDRLALLRQPARANAAGSDLLVDDDAKWPVSWSPDGANILYVTSSSRTGNDIWVLPLGGNRRPYAFAATEATENWAAFSPDGHYVVYTSTEETGSPEVYAAPFPPTGRIWRISADRGTQARWRRDNEILYLAPDRRLMAASVRIESGEIVVKEVQPLFTLTYPYNLFHAFDVTKDGQRILVNAMIVSPRMPTLSVSARP